jgi:hypoxanthine phosphoribosyltransferase
MRIADADIAKVLIEQERIHQKVQELGAEITRSYSQKLAPDEHLLVVGMLKGSVVFMADLIREIDLHCELDFMIASSYGDATESSGIITIKQDVKDIEGRHVLLIEDIVDSGFTMASVLEILKKRNPASIALCSLLDKPSRRKTQVQIDYCGFEIPDEFVVGYGLDYASRYRNLPYIGVLKPEIYTK